MIGFYRAEGSSSCLSITPSGALGREVIEGGVNGFVRRL